MGNLDARKKALQNWKKADFKDNLIFTWIISEHKDICLELLQLILPKLNIVDLKYIQKEDTFKSNSIFKGVRFDVYTEDETGRMYDIEMQIADNKNLGKRISYYQSYLTQHSLGAGQDYRDKIATYVIFICNFDYGGTDLPVYTTELRLKENHKLIETGEYNIILNAKAKDFSTISPELAAFLKYVATNIPTSAFTQKIADDIVILKNSALKGDKYMFYEIEFNAKLAEAAKKARAKGIAEGRIEGRNEGRTEGRNEGLAEGRAEGRTEGRETTICEMIEKLVAEGYTKEETLTAVTRLTSSTVEEAEGPYDKLFAK